MAKAEKKNTFNIDILTNDTQIELIRNARKGDNKCKSYIVQCLDDTQIELIRNKKCKSYIVQCLDDTQIELIRNKTTAYSMWKSLEERHEKKGVPGQMLLRKKLMNMKLKEVKDLEKFLSEFDETTRQLQVTGANVTKEDLICSLLLAMPPFFETIVTIIENMPEADLTIEMVKTKLRCEAERWEALNENKELDKRSNVKPAAFSIKLISYI
ncbi:hypothetical protein QE152_g17097 [Popillia japonica]|uniref:Retrovirus-related Pol polyprotein from transposon TNT 1-94 n=1 Tax=Popillia japonica TaxID=7064 RepID=A0AAW1L6E8_POPJA